MLINFLWKCKIVRTLCKTFWKFLINVCACCSVVSDSFVNPWMIASQALLPMGFFRQKYWTGLPFPTPGNLPDPGIESGRLDQLQYWQVDSLPTSHQGSQKIPYIHAESYMQMVLGSLFIIIHNSKLGKSKYPLVNG